MKMDTIKRKKKKKCSYLSCFYFLKVSQSSPLTTEVVKSETNI